MNVKQIEFIMARADEAPATKQGYHIIVHMEQNLCFSGPGRLHTDLGLVELETSKQEKTRFIDASCILALAICPLEK